MMMRSVQRVALILMAACALAACTPAAPATDTGPTVQELAATIAAATIQAGLAATATPTNLPTLQPPPAAKPTIVIHSDNTACRSGPGTDFKVVATFPAGTSLDILGKDSADGYWIALDPASQSPCWVQAQDGTPAGSFDLLPEMTPQAISAAPPNKPGKAVWNFFCDNTTLTIALSWNAPSGQVNGYRIYRDGNQVAELPPSQTSFTEKAPLAYGTSLAYAVVAYNDAGASPQTTWNIRCVVPPTARP